MACIKAAHERAAKDDLATTRADRLEDAPGELRTDSLSRELMRHIGMGKDETAILDAIIGGRDIAVASVDRELEAMCPGLSTTVLIGFPGPVVRWNLEG